MKLGLFLPLAGDPMRLRELVATAATVAERTGFHSLWFAEHVALFDTPASRYPYSANGSFPLTGEVGFVEPFVAIAFAAALTTRIRLGTGICLVPQRSPLYTAKQVADCDVLSGGRLDFGVGIGWLREEFEALGVPFDGRAARCREYLAAMRALWTEPVSRYEGKLLRVPALRMFPKPIQKPHPPIVFGGESDAALRRVADLGQGWYGFNLLPDEAAARIAALDALLARRGRKPESVEVSVSPYFKPARDAAALGAYAEADVEGAQDRVDDPEVADPLAGVDPHLPAAVDLAGGRRDDLARPVGRELEGRDIGHGRHPFAAPAREVGDEHVAAEVQLGLEQYPPAARHTGPAGIAREAADQRGPEHRRGQRVRRGGSGAREQVAVDDLRHHVVRERAEVVVCGVPLHEGHAGRIARGGRAEHEATSAAPPELTQPSLDAFDQVSLGIAPPSVPQSAHEPRR